MTIIRSTVFSKERKIRILFVIYLAVLSYFLFFAESMGRNSDGDYHYNLKLLHEIKRFVHSYAYFGWRPLAVNLLGNVAAFMPFGLMLPTFEKRFRNLFFTTAAGMSFSLLVELIQLATRRGSFDVDDILLNTTGCLLGYLLYRLLKVLWRKHET